MNKVRNNSLLNSPLAEAARQELMESVRANLVEVGETLADYLFESFRAFLQQEARKFHPSSIEEELNKLIITTAVNRLCLKLTTEYALADRGGAH